MWRWQLNGLNKRTALQLKLLGFSVGFHLWFLMMLLFFYRGYYAQLHVDISKTMNPEVPVVFMPLQKRASVPAKAPAKKNNKRQASVAKKVSEIKEPAAPKMPTRLVRAAKPAPAKVKEKKPSKKVEKKVIEKPIEQVKPVEQPAPVKEEKIVEQQPEKELLQEVIPTTENESDPMYIGQLEKDALDLQAEIQQEIEQHWQPPMGLAADLVCQIKVVIGWEGKAQEVVIEKPSGVRAFDIHARSAVNAMNFPKSSWGKELILHFKQ